MSDDFKSKGFQSKSEMRRMEHMGQSDELDRKDHPKIAFTSDEIWALGGILMMGMDLAKAGIVDLRPLQLRLDLAAFSQKLLKYEADVKAFEAALAKGEKE
jgi:hypothetical protein